MDVTSSRGLLGEALQQDAMSVFGGTNANSSTAISNGVPGFWQQQQNSPALWESTRITTESFQMAENPGIAPGWEFDYGMQLPGGMGPSPSDDGSQTWSTSTQDWQQYGFGWSA